MAFFLAPYGAIILLVFTYGRKLHLKKNYDYRPTVSIFLPTYNEAEFIEKKLENLINQTYQPIEILVYDCSTDSTHAIIEEYKRKFPIVNPIRQRVRMGWQER